MLRRFAGSVVSSFCSASQAMSSPPRSAMLSAGASLPFDAYLSHSAKDKAVARPMAERLRADEVIHKDEG